MPKCTLNKLDIESVQSRLGMPPNLAAVLVGPWRPRRVPIRPRKFHDDHRGPPRERGLSPPTDIDIEATACKAENAAEAAIGTCKPPPAPHGRKLMVGADDTRPQSSSPCAMASRNAARRQHRHEARREVGMDGGSVPPPNAPISASGSGRGGQGRDFAGRLAASLSHQGCTRHSSARTPVGPRHVLGDSSSIAGERGRRKPGTHFKKRPNFSCTWTFFTRTAPHQDRRHCAEAVAQRNGRRWRNYGNRI